MVLKARIVVEGQEFPVDRAGQLHAGMSPRDVEAVVGPPLRRASGPPGVWRYEFKRQLRVCQPYIGPVPLGSAPVEHHVLELTFGAGGLERALHREAVPRRTTERVLVSPSAGTH
jgi:outer membrane protein assembly factor BamE (lipoprotein component of BamABCDE complex)